MTFGGNERDPTDSTCGFGLLVSDCRKGKRNSRSVVLSRTDLPGWVQQKLRLSRLDSGTLETKTLEGDLCVARFFSSSRASFALHELAVDGTDR